MASSWFVKDMVANFTIYQGLQAVHRLSQLLNTAILLATSSLLPPKMSQCKNDYAEQFHHVQ